MVDGGLENSEDRELLERLNEQERPAEELEEFAMDLADIRALPEDDGNIEEGNG